jgi:signal transduction histidine kinase
VKSLYLRIYVTVVAVLLLFAFGSAWLAQRHVEQERLRVEGLAGERMAAWADLIQRSLPGPDAPRDEQAAAVREWSQRLRLPLALDSADGTRIGASEPYLRRNAEMGMRGFPLRLDDGRTLWVMRPGMMRAGGPRQPPPGDPPAFPYLPGPLERGVGLLVLLVALFVAVAGGAYPVVRALTRRLEALKQGVERFGAGALDQRVEVHGRDEVASVAASFNRAAARVEGLVRSHQSLLANASHELRSPLARLKMALGMLDDAAPAQRDKLRREIQTNIAELDALVDEVLLASRLDANATPDRRETLDLLALAAEEAARFDAQVEGSTASVRGDERLLRRALRNLLENARRYGGSEISVQVAPAGGSAEVRVLDRGPGVPEALRERIFEAFFRLPGHAEQSGGVGLGLSLVRQIALRHGGSVRCEAREGGGSAFVLSLPAAAAA